MRSNPITLELLIIHSNIKGKISTSSISNNTNKVAKKKNDLLMNLFCQSFSNPDSMGVTWLSKIILVSAKINCAPTKIKPSTNNKTKHESKRLT